MKDSRKKIESNASPKAAVPLAGGKGDISNIFTWAFCAYFLLIPVVAMALNRGYASSAGQTVTQDRIRFISANAATLTGFEGSQTLDKMPADGQIIIFVTTMLGAFFTLFLGGIAATRILNIPWADSRIFFGSVWAILIACLFGVFFIDSQSGSLSPFMSSLSAFSNSGMMLSDPPAAGSWKTLLILTPLSFVGGLGIVPLMDLFLHRREKRPILRHTWSLLALSGGVYIGALLLILLSTWLLTPGPVDFPRILSFASVEAINTRSAGLHYEFVGMVPRATQWIYLLLMSLGAGPGSFAGGFGLTTLLVIVIGVKKLLNGENPGKAAGLAMMWAGWFLGLVVVFFFAMIATNRELPADRVLFETISALCNVGLSFDRVMLVTPGLDVLSIAMLAGRLAPLAFLWRMASRGDKLDVLVG